MATNKPAYFGKDLEAMSFAENYHQWIADELKPYLGAEVAEIGAGVGNFSDFLLRSGVRRLSAFEPSSNMYGHLADKFADTPNVETYNDFFESVSDQFTARFDTVVYINVLEHIDNDHEALIHAYASLKGGGRLLVFVPALQALYSDMDRQVGHFRRYRRKQLVDVIEAAGFTVDKAQYFDILGIIPWYVAFVLLRQSATTTNVSAYDKLAVPLMRRVERIITPPIGKNLLAVAGKP